MRGPLAQAAETLLDRLGTLTDAPASIVWEPGLRRRRGLNGYTTSAAPSRLVVDPDGGRELVLETVAHEWIHSLEYREIVPRETLDVDGTRCTDLAIRLGIAIARQAAVSPALVALPDLLVAAILARTGRPPACFARTQRSAR